MSKRSSAAWVITLIAASGLTWGYVSSAQEPSTGKKVGEKVNEVIQDVKGGLRRVGNEAKDEFSRAKAAVNNMGVESRIYGRLHWDKSLNDATIELKVAGDGEVTLNGSVADEKAKAKAVTLASETVGVIKVVDHLAVRAAKAETTSRP